MLKELYLFDPGPLTWNKPITTGNEPRYRAGHTFTQVGSKIYLWGGGDGENYLNDLYILDIETLAWNQAYTAGTSPSARSRHTATLVNGNKLYIIGGGGDTRVYNDIYLLDTETMSWSRPQVKGTAPLPRWGHTCTLVGNKLVIFGGNDGTRMLNDIIILDMKKMKWELLESTSELCPCPRAGHTANYIRYKDKDYLIIYGGGDSFKIFNDLHILNLENYSWSQPIIEENDQPPLRCAHTSNVYDNKLLIFGGSDVNRRYNDVYFIEIPMLFNSHIKGGEEIRLWLEEFGMGEYSDHFINEDIDMNILPQLQESHLEYLKIPTLGARIKIFNEVKKLNYEKIKNGEENNNGESINQHNEVRELETSVKDLVNVVENTTSMITSLVNSLKLKKWKRCK